MGHPLYERQAVSETATMLEEEAGKSNGRNSKAAKEKVLVECSVDLCSSRMSPRQESTQRVSKHVQCLLGAMCAPFSSLRKVPVHP